jgi:hypothetical protein
LIRFRNLALTVICLSCVVLSHLSEAALPPITGSIEFFGSATPSDASLGGGPVSLHFNDPWTTLAGTVDYSGIPFATPVTFNDFTFTGDGTAAALSAPDLPLWTFSFNDVTYSFDLLNLTNAHTDAGSMAFTGNGLLHATGFADRFATIGIQGSGQNLSFNLSTSTTASFPESNVNSLVILGLGVLATPVLLTRRSKG